MRLTPRFVLLGALLLVIAILPMALSYLVLDPPGRWLRNTAMVEREVPQRGEITASFSNMSATVELPDRWSRSRPAFVGEVDYNLSFPAPEWSGASAIYIPRVMSQCEIYLNGQVIITQDANAGRRGSYKVIFAELPLETIRHGSNVIVARVAGDANDRAGLSQVYIGPKDSLVGAYKMRRLLQEDLVRLANWVILAMALPFLIIWLRDPSRSQLYGWFAAAAILFGLRDFSQDFGISLVPFAYLGPFASASRGWSALLLGIFLLRYSGFRRPVIEIFVAMLATIGTVLLFLVHTSAFSIVLGWRLPISVAFIFCLVVFVRSTFRVPTVSRFLLLCGLCAQIVPACHDLFWFLGATSFNTILWLPHSYPVLLIFMALILADEISSTKLALREVNRDLERRIAEARAELAGIYDRRQAAETQAAHAQERDRLMREMHDGIGTQLSLLLSGLHSGELAADQITPAVEATIDELYLLIDAKSADTETLVDALSNFRDRISARLTASGIATRWQIDDDARGIVLSAGATLHALRIAQECISNAVRHGKAKTITFHVAKCLEPDHSFVLSITDDGCGPASAVAATKGGGHGLKNMQIRAGALNGVFSLTRIDDLTVACLRV